MRIGNFSLIIPEGNERGSGHVELSHGQQYTIEMRNFWFNRQCDAMVTIDGKDMGTYRIYQNGKIVLERSHIDNGRFTFFRSGTDEAGSSGESKIDVVEKGLVSVRFRPSRVYFEPEIKTSSFASPTKSMRSRGGVTGQSMGGYASSDIECSARGMDAGVTGLTGVSNQQFTSVASLDYDIAEEVVINLRLVCNAIVREMKSVQSVRTNPIPEAVK